LPRQCLDGRHSAAPVVSSSPDPQTPRILSELQPILWRSALVKATTADLVCPEPGIGFSRPPAPRANAGNVGHRRSPPSRRLVRESARCRAPTWRHNRLSPAITLRSLGRDGPSVAPTSIRTAHKADGGVSKKKCKQWGRVDFRDESGPLRRIYGPDKSVSNSLKNKLPPSALSCGSIAETGSRLNPPSRSFLEAARYDRRPPRAADFRPSQKERAASAVSPRSCRANKKICCILPDGRTLLLSVSPHPFCRAAAKSKKTPLFYTRGRTAIA